MLHVLAAVQIPLLLLLRLTGLEPVLIDAAETRKKPVSGHAARAVISTA
jgi:hypothetical protein